ncbi:BTB/POZ domain-containing protein 9-like protein, partial [Dinothrombium tinctorium]
MSASFHSKLLSALYLNEDLCDIRFVIEGETIVANKAVLAASCEYFKRMLFGETNESKADEVVLKHTPKAAFKSIIKFIYMGSVETKQMDCDDLLSLISLSHQYQFKELFDFVKNKISEQSICIENINEVFKVAYFCEIDILLENCLSFIDENAKEIVKNHNVFSSFCFELVDQIVSRQTFVAEEIDIFTALMAWKQSNTNYDLNSLLTKIRWDQIDEIVFRKFITPLNVFTDSQYIDARCNKKGKRQKKNDSHLIVYPSPRHSQQPQHYSETTWDTT